jgi:hypothetical protein
LAGAVCVVMAPGKLGVCLNLFLEGIYDSLIFETGIYGSFTLKTICCRS